MTRHYRTIWHRPSWQGGDIAQPVCGKPQVGVLPALASWPMTSARERVTCSLCLHALHYGFSSSPGSDAIVRGRTQRAARRGGA